MIFTNINKHRYPGFVYNFPILLKIPRYFTSLFILRTWYVNRTLRKIFKNHAKPFKLIEAGCGNSDYIFHYAHKFPQSKFIGIDIIKDNISLSKFYSKIFKLENTMFRHIDLLDFEYNDKVDIITCIAVMNVVENDELAFANFSKLLKQNGKLLLYLPLNPGHSSKFNNWLAKKYPNAHYNSVHPFKQHYTLESVTEKLNNNGFEVVQSTYSYGKWGKVSYEIRQSLLMLIFSIPILSFVLVPLWIVLLPVFSTLMLADLYTKNKSGNGLLIVAENRG